MKLNGIVKKTLVVGALTWGVIPCSNGFINNAQANEAPTYSMGGVIEVDLTSGSDYDGTNSSDITLSTMELAIEAQVNEWVSGEIVLLWEEGDTEPVDLDGATITIGNTEKAPLYLTAGLMTVPFGVYETNMISDPATLEMGETGDSAILVGLEANGLYASAYTFNGDMDKVGDDDEINVFGASVGYAMESDSMNLNIGADYISNLANSDGLADAIGDADLLDEIGGMAAHVILGLGDFTCIAEHVSSDDIMGSSPNATHLEAALTTEMIGNETVLAATYQITSEAAVLGLPETRYGVAVSMGIMDNTSVTVEYINNEDYATEDDGSGESADQATAKLAIEF
ncbi:MAG: LbtU family siderophore porin [Desulfobulbaceae bacterium]|nr:LbtU family siderophore porin [Desulfobulbaceae bacterium]